MTDGAGPVKHHLRLCPTTGLEALADRTWTQDIVARLLFKHSNWFSSLSNLGVDRYYNSVDLRTVEIRPALMGRALFVYVLSRQASSEVV
jgi:hypothetical protein